MTATRILSVWLPSWPITVWRRKTGAWRKPSSPVPTGEEEKPVALLVTARGVRRLAAVDETAAALGLAPGQKAADAAAMVPELVTADADPEGEAQALAALADWCVRYSPAVAEDGADGLYLDIAGVAHLWGGEAAMRDDLVRRLAAQGVRARAAIADTPGAAWALARFGREGAIAPPGGQAPLLAPLPVAALRFDAEAAPQLPRLGLTTIGRLAALPRAELTRRFGQGLVLRLDQALGQATEALAFRRPASAWFDRLAFAEPISAPEDLARVAGDIARRLCARLEAAGRGARRFELVFHRLDGRAVPVRVGLASPGRDAVRLARLLVPKLDEVDPGFGVEVATLEAQEVEALGERQARLGDDPRAAHQAVVQLVDRLSNRLGEDRIWRAEPVESHVPERAVRPAPPLAQPQAAPGARWDPDRPRPLRLFRRPEPVETFAVELPDAAPRQFEWRGRRHRVVRAEGPERIADEWWRRPIEDVRNDRVRDYYRVEDEAGMRFWLYRQGVYGGAEPPKWWLHGLFG